MAYLKGKHVYMNKAEFDRICLTNPNTCFICNEIVNQAFKTAVGYAIRLEWLEANEYTEHLKQMIGDWSKPKIEPEKVVFV